ncbi:uncharacterized protein V1518DRAFT_410710 [Limtongia smithiae]|uniref:uncharacterized protein n=1 Tax=Limtongia smithiae TaxID=1125753 RepID=UPI0034D0115F
MVQHSLQAFLAAIALFSVLASAAEQVPCADGELQGTEGECYPVLFEPTEEFRPVLLGQEIPPGLHVRLNFETGMREAKLLSDADKDIATDDVSGAVVVVTKDEGEIVASADANLEESADTEQDKEEDDDGETWARFAYSHKPNPRISFTEHQDFEANLEYVRSVFELENPQSSDASVSNGAPAVAATDEPQQPTTSDIVVNDSSAAINSELLCVALKAIEDYSHEIDFGIKLASPEVVSVFLALIDTHKEPSIRAMAARVIGSSLRNNGPALEIAAPAKVVTNLLISLNHESEAAVRSRILFALASSIHGRFGKREFWMHKGGAILRKYFVLDTSETIQKVLDEDYIGRCGTFIEDSFVNQMMDPQASAESKKGKSKSSLSDNEVATEMGLWCVAFQDALSSDLIQSTQVRERVFSALSAIKMSYPSYCPVQDSFRQWIARKVDERATIRRRLQEAHAAAATGSSSSLAVASAGGDDEEAPATTGMELVFLDKLSSARHKLFGNPKAARKAFDDYHDEL